MGCTPYRVVEGTILDDIINLGFSSAGVFGNVTVNAEEIFGDGEDTLFGGGGRDPIWGGTGNDLMFGDFGNDFVQGDRGNDTVYGGAGADKIYGNGNNNELYGEDYFDNNFYNLSGNATTTVGGDSITFECVDVALFTPEFIF